MFTKVNASTKAGQAIISTWMHYRNTRRNIYQAYERPSAEKVRTAQEIENRARMTEGYNYDFSIAGAGSFNYSTVYSFTDTENRTHVIKDTKENTFEVIL